MNYHQSNQFNTVQKNSPDKYQFLTLHPRGHQEVAKNLQFQKFDQKVEL